jgi:quaternary ammonium compound-resistance protein SugE
MAWILLIVAGLFEIAWAIGLKYTDGFTRALPTAGTIAAMVISVWLLGIAMKTLPVGTAYSVWVGVGAAGTVILGIILFKEPANALRLISVALVIAGIVGLKFATPA